MKMFGGNIQFPWTNNYLQNSFDLKIWRQAKKYANDCTKLVSATYLGPQIIKTTKEIVLEINVCLIKNCSKHSSISSMQKSM